MNLFFNVELFLFYGVHSICNTSISNKENYQIVSYGFFSG